MNQSPVPMDESAAVENNVSDDKIIVKDKILRTPPKSSHVSRKPSPSKVSKEEAKNPSNSSVSKENVKASSTNPVSKSNRDRSSSKSNNRTRSNSVSTRKRKRPDINQCGVCMGAFDKGDKNCIECCLCNRWFHGLCVDFKEDELKALALIGSKVNWYCPDCNLGAANLHKHAIMFEERLHRLDSSVNDLQSKHSTLQQEVTSNTSSIDTNKNEIQRNSTRLNSAKNDIATIQVTQQANTTKITTLNTRFNELSDTLRKEFKDEISKLVDEKVKDEVIGASIDKKLEERQKSEPQVSNAWVNKLVKDQFQEIKEKEFPLPSLSPIKQNLSSTVEDICTEREKIFARRNQILVMNFKENVSSDEDKKQLNELFGMLHLDEEVTIEKADRLGEKRRDGKPRFLRVEMSNINMKRKILGNATKLRNVPDGHKFNKVFIKPNLTEKQQEESKNLQAELKKRRDKEPTKRMKISKGKIVVLPNSQ